ncbi:DUF6415 family natural product biosynthesis protein [Streptomyces sp. NPDC059161]|uniref:DUF6415 family natural product biosynthesis protein n=1 Tax=Streptomyces sp. NPDC059161 TaxID=3346749 RepID=UPI00368E6C8C
MNTSSDQSAGPGEYWGVAQDFRTLLGDSAPPVERLEQAEEIWARMRRHLARLSVAAEAAAVRLADGDELRSHILVGAGTARRLVAQGRSPVLPHLVAQAQEMARVGLLLVRCLADLANRSTSTGTRTGAGENQVAGRRPAAD